jgi:8-oxo-dGTP pyrophosphatase MutT (NUDIX family)
MNVRDFSEVRANLPTFLSPLHEADALVADLLQASPQARLSAVLVALFELEDSTHLIFIRRAASLRHGGEIAFPGGSADPADASLVATALREADEEIALLPERVQVLGLLAPVFTAVSNFLILPVVAALPAGPGTLSPQISEVAELLPLPLVALADPTIAHTELWTREGSLREVHFYDYGELRIWGATGRILANLLALLAK